MRSTHSLATLSISEAAYTEIKNKLLAASYHSQILNTVTSEMIDMHGIALVVDETPVDEMTCAICDIKITQREGQTAGTNLCYNCSTTPREEVEVKPDLSQRDKNYLVAEKDIEVDFDIKI